MNFRSEIFSPDIWDKFDIHDPEHRRKIAGALQYYLAIPDKFIHPQYAKIQEFMKAKKEIQEAQVARLQAFSGPADFPATMGPLLDKFHLQTSYDNGYEQIFDIRDFTGVKADSFSVADVQSGLTFNEIIPGEKLKVYQMSGTKATCYFSYYGGALGWFRGLFDDGQFWQIEDNTKEFRNKAYSGRAAIFYALLEAGAAVKSACIPVLDPGCYDCDSLAVADALALNAAALNILTNVRNKGYGVDPKTTQIAVVAPLQLRARLRMAMSRLQHHFVGAEKVIDFNFFPIITQMLTNTNQFIVVLPKYKLKGAYRMDLTLFSDFDILSYTDVQAGWQRFGGCIGDTDQIECVDATIPSGVGGGR